MLEIDKPHYTMISMHLVWKISCDQNEDRMVKVRKKKINGDKDKCLGT